jgi:VCBS repeat-containing protein
MSGPSITFTSRAFVNAQDKGAGSFVVGGDTIGVDGGFVVLNIVDAANNVVANALGLNLLHLDPADPTQEHGTWSAVLSGPVLAGLADGSYTAQATPAGGTFQPTATQTLIVDDVAPVAVADSGSVTAGATVTVADPLLGVLANDHDSGGGPLQVVDATGARGFAAAGDVLSGLYGDLTLNADGTYSYTADNAAGIPAGQSATETFAYDVADQAGNISAANLVFTVDSSVAPPSAPVTFTATTDNGQAAIGAGHVVTIAMQAAGPLTVSGTPTLQLNDGRTAAFVGGSGTSTLTFQYVVQPGDNNNDLQVTGLNLNGGSLQDGGGNLAGSVAADLGLRIDTAPPTITITSPDFVVPADKKAGSVVIAGTVSGAAFGTPITVNVLDANNAVVDSFSTTVSGHAWSVTATGAQFTALTDGSTYTVAAQVADDVGQTAIATQSLTVDETPPTVVGDTNSVLVGGTVTASTPAQGVLGNDLHSGPITLTALLVGGVPVAPGQTIAGEFGDLTMQADGTYTYTADNAAAILDVGHDGFLYQITDQTGATATGLLDIAVGQTPTIAIDPTITPQLGVDVPGFEITGTTTGVKRGSVIVRILDQDNNVLETLRPGPRGPVVNAADGTWSENAFGPFSPDLPDGVYTMQAEVTNLFGLTATAQRAISVQLDGAARNATFQVMQDVTFQAVESVTGDKINGVLFDNTGKYTVGSSVVMGPDTAGGAWTYTVTGIATADAAHQDSALSGFVYDTSYVDADLGVTVGTFYGAQGLASGDRTTDYSGSNYLGSEGDVVSIDGKDFAIASGKYVVGDTATVTQPLMQQVSFEAVESVTGDKIEGVLFDDTARYTVGSSVVTGLDNAGGSWTYSVTGIAAADAAHQDSALSGFVYDTSYVDADRGLTVGTFYGSQGLASGDRSTNYSGSNYLGSDGDVVTIGGRSFAIASGKYVVPETLGTVTASGGTSANLALLGNYAAASFVDAGSGQVAAPVSDAAPPSAAMLTSPHAG